MIKIKTPLLGWAFNDVLNELHQLVFHGVPDESEPFELTLLEREYIAFVLACYYQCGRCLKFHEHAIDVLRRKEKSPNWNWKEQLVNATLFLHLMDRSSPGSSGSTGCKCGQQLRSKFIQSIPDWPVILPTRLE